LKRGHLSKAEIVHHIQPIESGGEVLAMDNLVSLCRVCHGKRHRGEGGVESSGSI
jgi:5-methylcytosine-specific restriction endonuclease McrA